jgi:tetratricopeptide (TPR) repeat protein
MKLKFFPATISICLLALAIGIVFSAPAEAQSTDKTLKTSKTRAVANTSNPPIKADKIDDKTLEALALNKSAAVEKKTTSPGDADYWFDKGALCATYGNDQAAINYFQKAISLDPNRSGAYFEQGISYGQLGDFDKAVYLVNKALEKEPQNGLYHYGRGRVYLLAGKQDQAMQDFKKAAELDDEDAQAYLKHVAQHSK